MTDRIEADYLIETAEDPVRAAEVMAGEQSSGTFVTVPGEDAEGVRLARGVVERIEIVGEAERPSLPGATPGRPVLARRRPNRASQVLDAALRRQLVTP